MSFKGCLDTSSLEGDFEQSRQLLDRILRIDEPLIEQRDKMELVKQLRELRTEASQWPIYKETPSAHIFEPGIDEIHKDYIKMPRNMLVTDNFASGKIAQKDILAGHLTGIEAFALGNSLISAPSLCFLYENTPATTTEKAPVASYGAAVFGELLADYFSGLGQARLSGALEEVMNKWHYNPEKISQPEDLYRTLFCDSKFEMRRLYSTSKTFDRGVLAQIVGNVPHVKMALNSLLSPEESELNINAQPMPPEFLYFLPYAVGLQEGMNRKQRKSFMLEVFDTVRELSMKGLSELSCEELTELADGKNIALRSFYEAVFPVNEIIYALEREKAAKTARWNAKLYPYEYPYKGVPHS